MGMMMLPLLLFLMGGLVVSTLGVPESVGGVFLCLLAHPPDDHQASGEDDEGEEEAGDEDRERGARGQS